MEQTNIRFEGKDKKTKQIFVGLCCLLVLVGISIFLFALLHNAQQRLISLGEIRYQSNLLADQLRQSSDDLTRMVRTYVITGDSKFEKQFWEVLAIRNGEKSRPLHYDRIYWDFLTVGETKSPYPSGESVALKELMKQAGFSEQEFALLRESQKNSDQLVVLEQAAMNYMKIKNKDISDTTSTEVSPDQQKGIDILFGDKYHQAKIEIMRPINQFIEELDNRTYKEVVHQAFLLQMFLYTQILTVTLIVGIVVFLMRTAKQYHTSMVNLLSLTVKERTVELLEKNKEMEQFGYITSHDLRSPMVNIKGFTKILEENLGKVQSATKEELVPILDKEIPETISYIKKSISKVFVLLEGFSEVSRFGRLSTTIIELDMNKLINEVKSTFEIFIKEKGATIEIEDLPSCMGDEKQINQVVSNFLGNALKYLSPDRKGMIRITGKKGDDKVIYCFEDNGIGIPSSLHEHVFEIFHQIKPNSSEGEGLGLAIVAKIMRNHDGKVWIESEPDKGSKFFVSLPNRK